MVVELKSAVSVFPTAMLLPPTKVNSFQALMLVEKVSVAVTALSLALWNVDVVRELEVLVAVDTYQEPLPTEPLPPIWMRIWAVAVLALFPIVQVMESPLARVTALNVVSTKAKV